jgi:hypothetical protein
MNADNPALPASAIPALPVTKERTDGLPWYFFAVVFGSACIPLGALWDISWHSTIGRDTFWTPAHLAIHLGGTLPGLICGWLVLKSTFWPQAGGQLPGIRLWGFRGPLGAWVTIWGAFVMLLSAPFDNWWHNAYGLDVKILSPPHTLLALGMYAVTVGALLLVLSWQNRLPAGQKSSASWLFLFASGILVTMISIIITEYTFPNHQHTGSFYRVVCLMLPLCLVATARASNLRWAATGASATYLLVMLAMIWILPRFRAQPMLAPIYNQVDHMVPPAFPLLLIIPSIGIDLLMRRLGQARGFWRDTGLACLLGLAFFLLLLAAQWPMSQFMLSPASRNAFFGGDMIWSYGNHLGPWRFEFWDIDVDPLTLKAALIAIGLAVFQSRLALWFGNWLSTVKR